MKLQHWSIAVFCVTISSSVLVARTYADSFASVQSGDWNNGSNWSRIAGSSSHTFPQSGDSAIVNSGDEITLARNEQCGFLNVNGHVLISGFTLTLTAASGLTINSGGRASIGGGGILKLTGGGTHTINGPPGLVFLVSTAALEITANSSTIQGSDVLSGGSIRIAAESSPGISLSSQLELSGMIISGLSAAGKVTGKFINGSSGIVRNCLLSEGTIDDQNGARWIAASGTLQFSTSAPQLEGDFEVRPGGTLLIDASIDVCSAGDLDFSGGSIQIGAGGSFGTGGSCRVEDDLPFGSGTKWRRPNPHSILNALCCRQSCDRYGRPPPAGQTHARLFSQIA